ncbi:FliI/YscN family ATPase [Propionivibrio soli]|uniref:FliI/YscN family ATPase n=1 Tax=Propionivibrio soli TaxID=2976531 RepID=UPI0021E7AC85|nr:FliI/YscN family ATPase [Propionivibrio soli]
MSAPSHIRPDSVTLSDLADGFVSEFEQAITRATPVRVRGRVSKAVGMLISATGIQAHVGELCELVTPGEPPLLAEVVGFLQNTAILTPLGATTGISALTEVVPSGRGHVCPVGAGLLGRAINALGEPIDGRGPVDAQAWLPVHREPVSPLARQMITQALTTGIRAIDGLLTLGVGQRMGVFSPPGIGKSTLLGMLARSSTADVNVIALVGERGREVKEFIEHNLGPEGLAKSVLVVSTSDRPPMERVKSAYVATTIAEHFRDKGQSVLLLVDSLTRFARAQREIGLASGEPPTRRSYPPSIFSMLPQLLERAGQGGAGAITAIYSVLTEGDEENDPIAEEVRSIVDGHIVLSRKLAAANHFPAIDVLESVSRVMPQVTGAAHREAAAKARALLAKYQEVELLVQIGEYRAGTDELADRAIAVRPSLQDFLKQRPEAAQSLEHSVGALRELAGTS